MTKEEWDTIPNWSLLLASIPRREYPQRKFMLLSEACLRNVQPRLSPEKLRMLEAIELNLAGSTGPELHPGSGNWLVDGYLVENVGFNDNVTRRLADHARGRAADPDAEGIIQAAFFRDIFGNPFRRVSFDPNWRTSTVVALARQMYDSRDFSPMPILADALQDAGCEHPDILAHCRGDGPHVRGCWVVDAVLGKA